MNNYESVYRSLVSRLKVVRKKEKMVRFVRGVFTFFTILSWLLLVVLIAEAVFRFEVSGRLLLLASFLMGGAGMLFWFVVRPGYALLFRPDFPSDESLALQIGGHFERIRDRLANVLQVFTKHRRNPEGYSLELVDASLALVHQETEELDFEEVVSFAKVRSTLRLFGASLVAFFLVYFGFFSTFSNAAFRLVHPAQKFSTTASFKITVSPGDTEVVKGDPVEIRATVQGVDVSEAVLAVKPEEGDDFERHPLAKDQDGSFSFRLSDVRQDLRYFVQAGKVSSAAYSIHVVELPYIRNLQVTLNYPKYSKLGSQTLDQNVGDIAALKGTQVRLSIKANKTVKNAEIVFDDQTRIPLKISGQTVRGLFELAADGSYHISLSDNKGRSNAAPIEYRLSVLQDEFPLVRITYPGQDVDLAEDMLLPLTIEAEDDFGFSKMRVGYRILKGGIQEGDLNFTPVALPNPEDEKILLNHTWDLSKLNILPEDVVTYFAQAFDNDRVSGPKSARSQTYRVRFPSIYEIYADVASAHDETFEGLEETYQQSKKLQEKLDKIVQEMRKEPELNWEEKQKVQEAGQAQEKMAEKLEQVQDKLEEMVSKMEQNDLLSQETLEKYRELQNLMEEMLTPEMKEILREIQKSLEDVDPQKLKEAMKKFADAEEEFRKNIERTLNLLKQLQIEQKVDESVRKAQELLRRQEELNKKVSEAPQKRNREKYSQEQKDIQKNTADLGKELEELSQKMGAFPQMPQEQIEKAQNMIQQDGLESEMQQAIQQLQSGNMSGAQQSGQQISQNMQNLLDTLQSAKKELSEKQKQEIMQAFNRSAHNFLTLSKEQEQLMQSTQGKNRNSPGMRELADKQQDLLAGLSRTASELIALSQKTFFVTPEIGKALGKSMNGMGESIKGFEERDVGRTARNQAKAMSGLNEAAAQIRQSMQSMSGASSAIGFQEMMQRLMGLGKKQQGINQQTSQLAQQPGMSLQQQAAMSRLAAEQNALRKSLEQLRKEMGNRSDILGDLGQVSKDMEEVVKEFEAKNVGRKTIERQRRILSRLLDAQRSMHQREFSRKRKAETAKQYQANSPGALPANLGQKKARLQDDLIRALKEGYTKDYKELIRKYFEALVNEQDQGSLNN